MLTTRKGNASTTARGNPAHIPGKRDCVGIRATQNAQKHCGVLSVGAVFGGNDFGGKPRVLGAANRGGIGAGANHANDLRGQGSRGNGIHECLKVRAAPVRPDENREAKRHHAHFAWGSVVITFSSSGAMDRMKSCCAATISGSVAPGVCAVVNRTNVQPLRFGITRSNAISTC